LKSNNIITIFANTPKLFRLVWQARSVYIILLSIITIIEGILPVCQLWVGKLIVDDVVHAVGSQTPKDELKHLFLLAILALILTLAVTLMQKLRNYINVMLNSKISVRVNILLLRKSVELDMTYYETSTFHDELEMAKRSIDGDLVGVVELTFGLIRDIISAISILALFTKLGWVIMLIAILTTLPGLFNRMKYSRRSYYLRAWQMPNYRKASYYSAILIYNEHAKEVRLFNLGQYFIKEWNRLHKQFRREKMSLALRKSITDFLAGLSINIGYYACYAYAVYKAVIQVITIGDMTMYAQAISRIQRNMGSMFFAIARIYDTALAINSFFTLLQREPKVANTENPKPFPVSIKEGIEFRDVSFGYPGGNKIILQNLSFKVSPGESIALVGENGAGKTTLIKLLTRLYDPIEGDILIDGIDLSDFDLSELRHNIGAIFQDYVQYYLSAKENIGFGNVDKIEDLTEIMRSAEKSGADEFIEQFPNKYETQLGKIFFSDGIELSGGQWQKIALARAFIRDAQILILDEPTASLDAKTEYEVFQRFRELTQGKTTFLISHRFSNVRIADRILVIENGQIVENGNHDELMKLNGRYATMFNMQAEGYRD